jgi:hypothetical protein
MGNSLILRASTILTDTARPKFTLDPMVRPGTKFLFDFSRATSHPEGVITVGNMSSKTITDLSGQEIPMVFGGAGTWSCNADGSISNVAGGSNAIIGSAGQFDMAPAEYEFVATYWFSITTGYLVTSTGYMLYLSAGVPNAGQFNLQIGGAGRKATSYVEGVSAGAIGADMALDAPHMVAMHCKPSDGWVDTYFDGVRLHRQTGVPASFTSAAAASVIVGAVANRKSYRMSLTNITASIAAEMAAGYNANAILTGAQHIDREWKFCRNLIAAAPKTAFV